MNAAIELSHVTQRFGRKTPTGDARRTVLDDVSLEVPSGQILCLLGPSGCGKTTMVDLVMGNTVPVAGEVRVLGETAPYPAARRRVGYMPQDDALYDDITAEENLRFFGAMYGLGGARLSARIDAVLAFGRLTEGSLVLVVFVAVSLAITSVTLGLLVSGLANNAFQVIQLMLLFVMPQIVLCGLFDLSGTPEWLQALSW